jgi:hypothetical protein
MKVRGWVLKHGISGQSICHWRVTLGDMQESDAKCLKPIEEEGRRLRRVVADPRLDEQMLEDVLLKEDDACIQAVGSKFPDRDAFGQQAGCLPAAATVSLGSPLTRAPSLQRQGAQAISNAPFFIRSQGATIQDEQCRLLKGTLEILRSWLRRFSARVLPPNMGA